MGHTNDRSTKASSLVNPTSLNLQPRPFAPLKSDEKEESVARKSGYSENFLEKIINTPSLESATPVQRKSGNRLKAIATERNNTALQNQSIQRQEAVEEEKSEGEEEDAKEFIMNPEPPPVQRKFENRLRAKNAQKMTIQAKLAIGEPNDKYEQEADATAARVVQQINSPTTSQSQPVQRKFENRLRAKNAQKMAIQAKLAIGEPNDKYEQEADATAARVVQQINSSIPSQSQLIQRQEMEEDEELQMKPFIQRSENIGGGEASTDLESAIQSARGSGQSLDANLQQSMGQAMGADFSGVKVHTDSQSDQLNKSIQAKAFTTGQDLFFRQGAYEPSSRGGQELIAHELTHVVQQNGGAVQRHHAETNSISRKLEHSSQVSQPNLNSISHFTDSETLQMKKLTTMGGTFDTGQYEAVTGPAEVKGQEHTQDVGGVIDMSFISNSDVVGDFGLVQTGKAIRNKQPDYNKDRTDLKERMQDETGLDPGRFMDRSKYKENPIFGLQNQKDMLGNMEDGVGVDFTNNRNMVATSGGKETQIVKESSDEKNHDISDVGGKVGKRTSSDQATPASLRDEPTRTRRLTSDHKTGDAIKMEFETAALVLNGDMEGTYLGSVQWGFEIGEADEKATPLSFEIVSMGTPTPAFMQSANAWNEQAIVNTGGSNTTLSLPIHVTKHEPDLALQKIIVTESVEKEDKIKRIQERISLLEKVQESMDPKVLERLKQAVTDAKLKFNQAKLAVDQIKQQRKELAENLNPLRGERQEAGKKQKAGQTEVDNATDKLNRIGNKTIFYKERKKKDEAALKLATDKLALLDKALLDARDAVTQAESNLAGFDKFVSGFNQSNDVVNYRDQRILLQNEKADLANVSFELSYLLKELGKMKEVD